MGESDWSATLTPRPKHGRANRDPAHRRKAEAESSRLPQWSRSVNVPHAGRTRALPQRADMDNAVVRPRPRGDAMVTYPLGRRMLVSSLVAAQSDSPVRQAQSFQNSVGAYLG